MTADASKRLPTCRWCGAAPHPGAHCPLVKSIYYASDGTTVLRVDFHSSLPVDTGGACPNCNGVYHRCGCGNYPHGPR